jgi:hypothetical protein
VAQEIVGMNIHLASFCPVTIVERDNLLLPGNPSNGFVLFKGKLYSFVSIGALSWEFFFVLFLFFVSLSPWVRCPRKALLLFFFLPLPPFFPWSKTPQAHLSTGVAACTRVDACVRALKTPRVPCLCRTCLSALHGCYTGI